MARPPLLACLLVSACSVPNPWFGTPHVASEASTGEASTSTTTPTTDPHSTGDAPTTTGTAAASSTSSETTDGLTGVHTSDLPPDLPHDASTSTGADESTSESSSGSTGGDTSTGAGESSSSTAPVESDSDTEAVGLPACDKSDIDLLACYDFENDANTLMTLLDGSSYGHNGTTNGALYPPGYENQGLKIAANTKAEVEDAATLNPQALSMSAWVRITNLPPPGGAAIVEKSGQYSLKILENPIGLTCTINGTTISHNVSFPQDEWTHVACIYGSGQFKLFMNGQTVKAGLHGGNVVVGFNPLHVGCGGPACQFRLIGAILDRVRLWKGAINEDTLCAEANTC